MSGAQSAAQPGAATTTEAASFLDQVVAATKQTAPDQAQDLVKNLVEQALAGTVTFDKNVTRTFERAIAAIDRKLSEQLNAIIHNPKFLALEGSWRGLHYLVMNSETSTSLKLRVLNLPKRELSRDLQRAVEFDQSQLFKKIYENEFGTPGGEPYGALIGDYEWTQHPDDIETLRLVSNVSAAAFAPFISAAGAGMFGFDNWPELAKPRDLAKIFETQEYTKWRSFRDSEDARFVNLVMPRTLARLPYGAATKAIDEFSYEEAPYDDAGAAKSMEHNEYCWMNAAYAMGTRLTNAFAQYGFCTAIRGAEGGGKVENLPYHVFTSDDGDQDAKCPTEIAITDRREFELSNLGFLPLCHYKNTDYSVFFGAQIHAEAEEIRSAGSHRERRDLGTPAVHHGLQPLRPLPEGHGARQDRQLHGGRRLRALAEPLDQQLRQRQRERRPGDEGPLPAARGKGRGAGDPRQARLVQRGRVSTSVAADGRADHQPAHGRAHPGRSELTATAAS